MSGELPSDEEIARRVEVLRTDPAIAQETAEFDAKYAQASGEGSQPAEADRNTLRQDLRRAFFTNAGITPPDVGSDRFYLRG